MLFHINDKPLGSTRLRKFFLCIIVPAVLCSACQSVKPHTLATSDTSADMPVARLEYIIGPEDVLEINVWKNADLSKTVTVRPDGMITLPLIGEIQAGGNTPNQLREIISKRLEKYKDIPEVTVTVSQVNSYIIYVLGEVKNPGKYQVRSYTTVLQAVASAGGFSQWAEKNDMVIIRKTQNGLGQKIKVRYKDILRNKGSRPDELLYPGDTLVVP